MAKAARSGDWDKAMANLRPYPSFVPRANVLDAFVEALIKEGRPAQAYDILKEHGGQSLGGAAKARPLNLAFWSRKGYQFPVCPRIQNQLDLVYSIICLAVYCWMEWSR